MNATHVVLGVVILLVIFYCVRCHHLIARRDNPRARLDKLGNRLKRDIRTLVKSGRSLDWVHYADEAHRGQEDLREHLRNYGTISLATGVGGTMGALALHLLTADPSQGDALELLLGEMGLALVASGTGVLGNLAILWGLLPRANRLFNPELDRFLRELRNQETRSAKQETLGPAIPEIIVERLGEELRDAIARVPTMFEQLGETATTLETAAEKLDTDVAQLTSASNTLARSTVSLNRMPEQLDTVLGKALAGLSSEADALRNDMRAWESERRSAAAESHANLQNAITRASSQHNETADQLKETTRALAASVAQAAIELAESTQLVAASVEGLPGLVTSAVKDAVAGLAEAAQAVQQSVLDLPDLVASVVEASGESLGRQLSDAVEPHVTSFGDGLAAGLDKTIEWQNVVMGHLKEARRQHDRATRELLTSTNDVVMKVRELPDAVADGVKKVSDKLGREFGFEARQHVAQLRSTLHENAKELRRNLERHESHLLNTTVQELRKVSEKLLGKTVRDLEEISEKLAAVLDGFPEHVAAASTRLDDAEDELKDIQARIKETSLALRSAHDETAEMLAGLTSATEGLGQVIGQLAEALRSRRKRWWQRLWRRSPDGATSETPGKEVA